MMEKKSSIITGGSAGIGYAGRKIISGERRAGSVILSTNCKSLSCAGKTF